MFKLFDWPLLSRSQMTVRKRMPSKS